MSDKSPLGSYSPGVGVGKLDIKDVDVVNASIVGGPANMFYVYMLSVTTVSGVQVVFVNATVNASISITGVTEYPVSSSPNGYGLSWHPGFEDKIGVVWSNNTGLYLTVFQINSDGSLTWKGDYKIADTSARAAEAPYTGSMYSPGFPIAASDGRIYYFNGTSLNVEEWITLPYWGSKSASAMVFVAEGGREAAYMLVYTRRIRDSYICFPRVIGSSTVISLRLFVVKLFTL